jgi:hypothetical protein
VSQSFAPIETNWTDVRVVHHLSGWHFVETRADELVPGDVIRGRDGLPWMVAGVDDGQLRARHGDAVRERVLVPDEMLPVLRHNPGREHGNWRRPGYYAWERSFKSEREFADHVLERLSRDFHVFREVTGTHYRGHALRVDAVLAPRDPGPWKDDDPTFAVEFKWTPRRPGDYLDMGTVEKWKAQVEDYTHTEFGCYGHLRVFLCVSTGARLFDGPEGRRLWQAGVGELVHHKRRGLALCGPPGALWTETEGPCVARTCRLSPKTGAR